MGPRPAEAFIVLAPAGERIERERKAEHIQQQIQQRVQRDQRIQCADDRHHAACLEEEQPVLAAVFFKMFGLDGAAALMRPAMYGAYHHITVLGKEDAPCDHMYDVVGGLCENNDKFAIDRMLPKIDIGDGLSIHDTGAHGSAMGYTYNGKLRSAEVLLCEDGSHRLIRRAETPRDYFATLDFLPLMKPLFED